MISVRKRKNMIRKLHNYFSTIGYVPSENEYGKLPNPPIRRAMLDKYLGSWPRMIAYLERYYPIWKTTPKVAAEAPKIDLDALENYDDE